MGIVANQSIKNSIYMYTGMFLGALSVVVFYPNVFYNHPENLGLLQIIVASSTIIHTITYLGAPRILIRYFPKVNDKNQLISLSFLIPSIGFLLFALFYYFFNDLLFLFFNADDIFQENFHFVFILVLFLSFYEILSSLSRSLLNATLPIFLKEIFLKGSFILLLTLHWLNFISFTLFLFLYVSVYFLMIIILFYKIIKKYKYKPTLRFDNIESRNILKYGMYVLIGGSSAMIVSKVDMMMIAHIMPDLENVAYYTIPFFIGNSVLIPSRSIASIASPLLAKAWKQNDISTIKEIYLKSALNQFLFGSIIFLVIWLNIDDILSILPDKFNGEGVKLVIFFIGLSKLFSVATGVNGQIIINSKYYHFDLYSNILLLIITVITNYIFIQEQNPLSDINILETTYKIKGIAGAAFATALSVFIFNFIKMIYLYYKLKIQPFNFKTIKLLCVILFVYFVVSFIPVDSFINNIYFNIIVRCFMLLILFSPLILILNISRDINKMIFNILKLWRRG